MSIAEAIQIATPLVWVESHEPRRVLEMICQSETRPVFRMDMFAGGLVQWMDGDWKTVLVPKGMNDEGQEILGPIAETLLALMHVLEHKGVFVAENAHFLVFMGAEPNQSVITFLQHLEHTYTDALLHDDNAKVPMSVIMISVHRRIPAELARACTVLSVELPGAAELGSLITHVAHRVGHTIEPATQTSLVRAGLGMSEHEFLQGCARSLREHKRLHAEYINQLKIDKLAADGILEIRRPDITTDDIGGLEQFKEILHRVQWIWNNRAEAEALGLAPLHRILLLGVSGSGKSALAEASASALGLDLAKFGASSMMSKWVGESESNMRQAFAQVKAMRPIVLWVDEFGRDMSGGMSSGEVDGGTTDRVHGEFLTGMQELADDVLFVGAANRVESLPPEMLRADRFDLVLFVGFPTAAEREAIWKIHLGSFADSHDLGLLAEATPFFTGAEIKALIREVRFRVVGDHHRPPTDDDYMRYAPNLKGRVWVNHHDQIVAMYQRAQREWGWASAAQEAEATQVIEGAVAAAPQVVTEPPAPALSELLDRAWNGMAKEA